ncbi:CshA/CshB family fibrillar adhesin-related protein [Clostridium butyricum]|uniref:Surface adhesin CshA non-repetitive domain-containing protein n=1 Tax=Clostridium butyricum E4 str. BoNT E BL5262 TaxID=632245 RepID=C4IEM4_CLOBU|nr:CshA/CshB family fibrillar adhesin-related protein [Clostridium butyricum]EDT74283.1 hypothetical protein CBY_3046 [Clostridium butyricum 5521]EEP55343.1 hypothetical protein CLP_3849 [Clostridium butyricum E4 str. BoNT E BL5262]NFL29765.1 hypothetical protein [Clostridium butyricum]NFS16730.1 hypothetical protein [Clostridium butyricum]
MADINSSVRYANPNSPGPLSNKIGWIEYSPFNSNNPFTNGIIYTGINTISKPAEYKISFNIKITQTPKFTPNFFPIFGAQPPVYDFAAFGNTGYIGVDGNVDLYMLNNAPPVNLETTILVSNIKVTNPNDEAIANYDLIAVDGETTNSQEIWQVYTDGSPWIRIGTLPAVNDVTTKNQITGIGTHTVKSIGTTLGPMPAQVFSTHSPTMIEATISTFDGNQGIVLGVIVYNTPKKILLNCC